MEIRRKVKNVVYKYSEPERLVREATSNDPWGPTSTVMSELAELSYNHTYLEEIMALIWKRVNDKGKNWRHVYKSLVLLDYLIKSGDQRVSSHCLDNIHYIETLKDFQYFEEHKDHGIGIREKSKALINLLKDNEVLCLERQKGQKIKEKFKGTRNALASKQRRKPGDLGKEIRRQVNEKELKLPPSVMKLNFNDSKDDEEDADYQMAIALSKEEHELSMKRKLEEERREEVKLMMALEQSRKEDEILAILKLPPKNRRTVASSEFLDFKSQVSSQNKNLSKHIAASRVIEDTNGFHGLDNNEKDDPWGFSDLVHTKTDLFQDLDSWQTDSNFTTPSFDDKIITNTPWINQKNDKNKSTIDDIFGEEKPNIQFDANWSFNNTNVTHPSNAEKENKSLDIWKTEALVDNLNFTKNITGSFTSLTDMGVNQEDDKMKHSCSVMNLTASRSKMTPQEFLGENAKLVNLDNLLPMPKAGVYRESASHAEKTSFGSTSNPFNNQLIQIKKPMNQMGPRAQQKKMFASSGNINNFTMYSNYNSMSQLPQPIIPNSQNGFSLNNNTCNNDGGFCNPRTNFNQWAPSSNNFSPNPFF